jgi:c-di-GMP-binding flagellar brake protein YcgR
MTTAEKRRHYRVNSQNLLNYACIDENQNKYKQGMGRTLNVSETGILLETHIQLEAQSMVELTIGLEEDLVTLQGTIIRCLPGKEKKFEAGIQFSQMDENAERVLKKFIAAFQGKQSTSE